MKTLIKLVVLALLCTPIATLSQTGINYKALIKDGSGEVVANTSIIVQFQILKETAMTTVYQETHNPTTDANGFVMVNIGEGTVDSGVFGDIDWGSEDHYLNVHIDTGSGLADLGTTRFMAVPYALYSEDAGNQIWKKNESDIFYDSGKVGIGTTEPGEGLNTTFDVIGGASFRTISGQTNNAIIFDYSTLGPAHRLYTDASYGGTPSDLIIGTYPNGHSDQLYLQQSTGNVGIGTNTPGDGVNTKFDVIGRVSFRTDSNEVDKALIFDNSSTAQRLYTDAISGTPTDLVLGTYPNGHSDQLYLQQSTGNVGIGTTTPGDGIHTKFDVIGRVSFRTISGQTNNAMIFDYSTLGPAHRLYTDTSYGGTPSDLIIGTYPNGHSDQLYLQQSTGNVGVGTSTPQTKLDVDGAIRISHDPSVPSADNVGAIRYRVKGNTSYCEMVMQTSDFGYSWVIIHQNSW